MRTRPLSRLAPLLALAVLGAAPRATAGSDPVALLPAAVAGQDQLGHAIAVSGDTIVVGAVGADDLGLGSGSASVFVRSGNDWLLEQTLAPGDGQSGSVFGSAVAVDGDRCVVGATEAGFFGLGAAYVFERVGGVWTEQAKLLPGTPSSLSNFGASVALDGDTVVVGAPHPQGLVPVEGEAYVYTFDGLAWSQQARLQPLDGIPENWFGSSVAVSGERLVVGASKDHAQGSDSGAAYVYRRSAGVWAEEQKLSPSDGAALDRIGVAVSIDDATVVLGAWGHDHQGSGSGAAWVFVHDGASWTEQAELLPDDGAAGAFFGGSLALSGERCVVGANLADGSAPSSGSAYAWQRAAGAWEQVARLDVEGVGTSASFGYSVGLDGDTAAVGAKLHDGGANQTGGAWALPNVTSIVSYGQGCAGTGGLVPELVLDGDPQPGGGLEFVMRDGLPGATAWLLFGALRGEQPIGLSGCTLWVEPVLLVFGPLTLAPDGGLTFAVPLAPTLAPGSLTLQLIVIDPGAPAGKSGSGGVELHVGA